MQSRRLWERGREKGWGIGKRSFFVSAFADAVKCRVNSFLLLLLLSLRRPPRFFLSLSSSFFCSSFDPYGLALFAWFYFLMPRAARPARGETRARPIVILWFFFLHLLILFSCGCLFICLERLREQLAGGGALSREKYCAGCYCSILARGGISWGLIVVYGVVNKLYVGHTKLIDERVKSIFWKSSLFTLLPYFLHIL